ncbi:MAG TPA: STAS domain-containing protein [Melioribacteraceae bacterium]|nr:STAS domain-containing protein [Melioribacteraceae bacterium]
MGIKEEIYGDVLVARIIFDRATLMEAEQLRDLLSNSIANGYKKIIIDLSECEFIDSTFLGVIVNSLKKVAKVQGDLKLVGFKPAVKAMFELTRMFRVFESFSNLDDAVNSF